MNIQRSNSQRSRKGTVWILYAFLVMITQLRGQSAPAFDVATVKPSTATNRSQRLENGRFVASYQSLQDLILFAYQRQFYEVIIPSELGGIKTSGARFDIEAQGPSTSTMADARIMLRSLLADRFSLRLREEIREMPVYSLVLARTDGKLGSGLVKVTGQACDGTLPAGSAPDQPRCGLRQGPPPSGRGMSLTVHAGTMQQLSSLLSTNFFDLGRRVIDNTKLEGEYNVSLDFAFPQLGAAPGAPVSSFEDGDPVTVALPKQLGLKLDANQARYAVLVVENATKPGQN